jgi:ABC-2 type transport system ATP-binding protein
MSLATSPESSSESSPLAQLRGVHHRYGRTLALDGIDLSLHGGEVLALLGANGAGKSTAVAAMLGLLKPDAGEALLFGRSPALLAARRRAGVMLQSAGIPENSRVDELLALTRSYYPSPRSAAECVALAGLEGLLDRRYGRLSGGQQRRVQFALAICGRPRIVLVDEPTTGLDVEARRAFWAVLRGLRLEGAALVLTTHYLEEADALADRVVVMRAGRAVAEGTPMQLKARSGGTRVQCRSALGIDDVRTLPGVREAHREGDRLLLRCGDADAVIRELLRRDPALAELQVVPASLEDSLLELTHDEGRGATPHRSAA